MHTLAFSAAAASKPTIQVHVKHKCPIVSAGLRAILSTQPDFHLSAGPRGACVVIADYDYGVSAARESGWDASGSGMPPVLTLTDQSRAGPIRHALASGVRGYVIQGCEASEVIDAVRMLSRGDSYLSPTADRLAAAWRQQAPLTQREAEVLRVLVCGNPDKVIARTLGIGLGTVKCHMKQLFLKLGVSTRTQAVIRAMDLGLDEAALQRMMNHDELPTQGEVSC